MKRHECPDDADAFFAQLLGVLVYRPEPPPGFTECRICGGLIEDRKTSRTGGPAVDPISPTEKTE